MPNSNHKNSGNSGGKSNSWKNNNTWQKNDSTWAHKNAYRKEDAYRYENNYRRDDVWKNDDRDRREQNKLCYYWFGLKLKMQDIFSSDSGAQAENRVFHVDTDPYFLSFLATMTGKSIVHFITVPLMMFLFYFGALYFSGALYFAVLSAEVIYFLVILYCPAWQVYSSYEYSITSTGESFYNNMAKYFKFYVSSIILSIAIGLIVIIALVRNYLSIKMLTELFNNVLLQKIPTLGSIYEKLHLKLPSEESFIGAVWSVELTAIVTLFAYFVFSKIIRNASIENYKINKRTNIDLRTKTIVGKLDSTLDE